MKTCRVARITRRQTFAHEVNCYFKKDIPEVFCGIAVRMILNYQKSSDKILVWLCLHRQPNSVILPNLIGQNNI